MVIKTNLSKTDKLNYLKKSLIGSVAGILRNLPASENNFDRAWQELLNRYDNTRLLKQAHVVALLRIRSVIRPKDYKEYERILNEVQEHLMSLEDLGSQVKAWDELLLATVTSKFDNVLLDDWERYLANLSLDTSVNKEPTYEEFKQFVWKRIEACSSRVAHNFESALRPKPTNNTELLYRSKLKNNSDISSRSQNTTRAHVSSFTSCPHCSSNHLLFQCHKFRSLPVEKRSEVVQNLRVCYNCLRSNHMASACSSSRTCNQCQKRHHSLLHTDRTSKRRFDSDNRTVDNNSQDLSNEAKKQRTSANNA